MKDNPTLCDSQARSNLNWYALGQGVSILGNFLQSAAVGLLILDLVPKSEAANWVGRYNSIVLAPAVLLAPFAGVALDFWCKKKVLIWASVVGVLYSLTLALFAQQHQVTTSVIISVAWFAGLVNAFDAPGRTAIVKDITNKSNEDHGGRLVILIVNLGQILAPSLAGYLVSNAGFAWTFTLNAMSFIALMVAFMKVKMMKRTPIQEVLSLRVLFKSVVHSIHYTYTNKSLRVCTVLMAVMTGLGYSYGAILPVIARDMYHGGALVAVIYGKLGACLGSGSLTATLSLIKIASRFKPATVIFIGGGLSGVGLVIFAYSEQLWLGCAAVFAVGFGLVLLVATFRVVINKVTDQKVIGAVSGISVACFYGSISLGMLIAGECATIWGCRSYLYGCGAAMLLVTILLPMFPHLQKLDGDKKKD